MGNWHRRVLGLIGVLLLGACDAGPSAVLPDGEGASPAQETSPASPPALTTHAAPEPDKAKPEPIRAPSDAGAGGVAENAGTSGEITRTRYGEWPLWSYNRKYTAQENATYHFEKHGSEFGIKTYEAWLGFVHGFIHSPPKGTQTIRRNNGDTLFYDPAQNIFAVMTKKGAPRTLFRPDDGAAYWQKQKEIESRRRTVRTED